MSFIVPDAPMPENCFQCPCLKDDWYYEYCNGVYAEHNYKCGITGTKVQIDIKERLDNCRLFELKRWEDI